MEFEKLWIHVGSIIEILSDQVIKLRDGKGKVIYSFGKLRFKYIFSFGY